jgi:predicted RecA/RadA family phage recombinase
LASVPNRANPLAEYNTINTTTLNATSLYAPTVTGSDFTTKRVTMGVNTTGTSGSLIISGFTAAGAIRKYQPVLFPTDIYEGVKVSGSVGRNNGPIFGVAANAAATGEAVSVILQGLVPYHQSGATAITRGAQVIPDTSGSVDCVASRGLFENTTGSASYLGIAVITGSAAITAMTHVWVNPGII